MTGPDVGGGANSPRSTERYAALAATVQDLLEEIQRVTSTVDGLVRLPDPKVLDDKGGDIPRLRESVTLLAADVTSLLRDQEDLPALPCWVDLDQAGAAGAWEQLHMWVGDVLLVRYPRIAETRLLPPCWYRHPETVEQLSWLHVTWCHAFRNSELAPTAAAEWHVRYLEHVISWLGQHLECRDTHQDYGPAAQPAVDGEFDAFVRADVAARPQAEPPADV